MEIKKPATRNRFLDAQDANSKNKKHLDITTIKLNKKTKARLDKLKSYKRETYDDILQKILEILNLCKLSSEKAKAKLIQIDKENASLKQVKPLA